MIDLTRTEREMLTEIDAGPEADELHLRGTSPETMLPQLLETFSRRYPLLSTRHVYADLNELTKKGLGNAFKWGNRSDPQLGITVRAVMTDTGTFVAITDQGSGFDVSGVLARFGQGRGYFHHGGSGFSCFEKTTSVVSYTDEGRTLLIRFLCSDTSELAREGKERAPKSERRLLEVTELPRGCQLKVKGHLRPDGRFIARKVAVKSEADGAAIDGVIRDVDAGSRQIRVLSTTLRLPEDADIISPEQRRLGFDALQRGQIVELTGRYAADTGFLPHRVQIRGDSEQEFAEIQGRLEGASEDRHRLRVLGIEVELDADTQIRDKR